MAGACSRAGGLRGDVWAAGEGNSKKMCECQQIENRDTTPLNPFPANVTLRVTGARRAPLDAPHGPSETVPVLRDPWRW